MLLSKYWVHKYLHQKEKLFKGKKNIELEGKYFCWLFSKTGLHWNLPNPKITDQQSLVKKYFGFTEKYTLRSRGSCHILCPTLVYKIRRKKVITYGMICYSTILKWYVFQLTVISESSLYNGILMINNLKGRWIKEDMVIIKTSHELC